MTTMNTTTLDEAKTQIAILVKAERHLQDLQWGEQRHKDLFWLGIVTEEVGEAAREVIEDDVTELVQELVQVMAVCHGWLEHIFTRDGKFEVAAYQMAMLAQRKTHDKLKAKTVKNPKTGGAYKVLDHTVKGGKTPTSLWRQD